MDELNLIVPAVETSGDVSTMQLPDIDLYNYWNMYSNRILNIEGEVTAWDYSIVKSIMQINMADKSENPKPIIILIRSNGGLLNIMFSIINAIQASRIPVWTVNMGEALSAACLVFLAGDKRFTTPYSWAMAHSGSGEIQGTYAETQEAQKVWANEVKLMWDYIMERTNVDKKLCNKYKTKDWWLNADQQIEYGFATDRLESIEQLIEAV